MGEGFWRVSQPELEKVTGNYQCVDTGRDFTQETEHGLIVQVMGVSQVGISDE